MVARKPKNTLSVSDRKIDTIVLVSNTEDVQAHYALEDGEVKTLAPEDKVVAGTDSWYTNVRSVFVAAKLSDVDALGELVTKIKNNNKADLRVISAIQVTPTASGAEFYPVSDVLGDRVKPYTPAPEAEETPEGKTEG